MNKRTKRQAFARRVIKVGGAYLDTHRDVVVTVEEHEIIGGKRTGRLIVIGADGAQRFARRWISLERDLVEVPTGESSRAAGPGSPRGARP